ncbi:MAG: MFS transporter [Thermoprotei archaeon]
MRRLTFRKGLLYLPGPAWILAASSAVWSVGGSMANPFQSIFFQTLGTPVEYIGVLASVSSVVTAVAYLVGGYVADVWGRRRVIAVFSLVAAANGFIYVFINHWQLLFIPIIIGSLSGIYTPAFNAVLNDCMEPSMRPRGFASYSIVTTVPSVFSPYLGGYLMHSLGYLPGLRVAYFASGLLGVLAVSWRALKLQETHVIRGAARLGLVSFVANVIRNNVSALKLASSDARRLIVYSATSSLASGLTGPYVSVFLIDGVHLSAETYGLLTGISAITTIALLLPAASLADKIGLRRAAILSAFAAPVSMIVFVSANGMNDLVTWSMTGGVSGALLGPTVSSLQGNAVPKELRGRLMAMFSIVPLLVTTPTLALSGYLYTDVSHLAPFIASIPVYAISVMVIASVRGSNQSKGLLD